MKTHLMHRDRDFDLKHALPWNSSALTQDLELNTLLLAMSGNDKFVLDVSSRALLACFNNDVETIRYRQEILKDCLQNPAVVMQLYELAVEAIQGGRKHWYSFRNRHPSIILYESNDQMHEYMGMLRQLRKLADTHAGKFKSSGFAAFFMMIKRDRGMI